MVDFSNTVIIATSNIGFEIIQHEFDKDEKKRMPYEELRAKLKEELKHHFRPEFLNRLDEIIVFRGLSKEQIGEIVKLQIGILASKLNRSGLNLKVSQPAVERIVELGYDPHFGARELRRVIQREIENRISDKILQTRPARGTVINVDFKNSKFVLES